jgi:hypothetical protein
MIGLAAASQIGIIPTWLGASVMLGLPASAGGGSVWPKVLTLLLSIIAIIIAAGVTLMLTRITADAAAFQQSNPTANR